MDEPINNHDARQLIRQIVKEGTVVFTSHALERMDERGIRETRIYHALNTGWCDGCDLLHGSWRYRMVAHQLTVVVTLDGETKVIVITTWE